MNKQLRDLDIESRLELIESRQQWLFENSERSRMLFEEGVTFEQNKKIENLLESIRRKLADGERVTYGQYEKEVKEIFVNSDYPVNAEYTFAYHYLLSCFKEERWVEVFVALYKDYPGFNDDIKK